MTRFFVILILMASFLSGCASTNSHPIEFHTTTNASFTINSDQFDTIDIQSSEIQLWQGSDLVGSIMTIQTNPDYQSAIKEVEEGFIEAQRGPGEPHELALPDGAYGFSVSFGGHTTAFIAVHNQPESWLTISTRDALFEEILSSIVIE
ncbi:MAG TPA: hypothetical protein DHU56_18635 [Marinobacter sp.]|jgi:hypothetical protein|nr:hypothetical protein [Marinobacter sp.]